MDVDAVIEQLKSCAPVFGGNVAGGAHYERAVQDQTWLPLPAAYVVPLEDEVTPNRDGNGLYQIVTETVGIVVVLDNSPDRRGQAAATAAVDAIRAAVFRAVLNWRPDPARQVRGFSYARAGLVEMDRARLRWQFDFAIETTITDADGWQPSGPPLTEIDVVLVRPTPPAPVADDAVPVRVTVDL